MLTSVNRAVICSLFWPRERAAKFLRIALYATALIALGRFLYQRAQRRRWEESGFTAKLERLIESETGLFRKVIKAQGLIPERDSNVLLYTNWQSGQRAYHFDLLRMAAGLNLVVRRPTENAPHPTVDATVVASLAMIRGGGLIRRHHVAEGGLPKPLLVRAHIKINIVAGAMWEMTERGGKNLNAHHFTLQQSDRNQLEIFGKPSSLPQFVVDNIVKVIIKRPSDACFRCLHFVTYILTPDPERYYNLFSIDRWKYSALSKQTQIGDPICLTTDKSRSGMHDHYALTIGKDLYLSIFGDSYLFATNLAEMQKFYETTDLLAMSC